MSRYTKEELQLMCKEYLRLESSGDQRCGFFLMFMSINTGYSQDDLKRQIKKMANTGSWT